MAASRCRKLRKDDVEPIEAKSKVGGDGSNLRSEVTVSNSKMDGFKVRSYKYGCSLLFDRFFGLLYCEPTKTIEHICLPQRETVLFQKKVTFEDLWTLCHWYSIDIRETSKNHFGNNLPARTG